MSWMIGTEGGLYRAFEQGKRNFLDHRAFLRHRVGGTILEFTWFYPFRGQRTLRSPDPPEKDYDADLAYAK